jgi:hypothetical protein
MKTNLNLKCNPLITSILQKFNLELAIFNCVSGLPNTHLRLAVPK